MRQITLTGEVADDALLRRHCPNYGAIVLNVNGGTMFECSAGCGYWER